MKSLVLCLCLLAAPVLAQAELPALYDVSGVASNDTLNVREGPTVGEAVFAELAPNRTSVEVIRLNESGTWGQINVDGRAGWVSMTYMARQPFQDAGEPLPVPMSCYGTEPFWSLDITSGEVTFTDHGMDAPPLTMPRAYVDRVAWSPRGALVAGDITGFLSREMCSDGMSDQDFGWRIDFVRSGNGGDFAFSGCCTLEP